MKTYNTQDEIDADILDGILKIDDDITITFNCSINASVYAWGINAMNINAVDINACDINAWDINAWDINAWDINARNINADDINAMNINADDISFYAVCFAYCKLKCRSISGHRGNSKYFCLDSDVKFVTLEE